MPSIETQVSGFEESDKVFSVNLTDEVPFDADKFDTLVQRQNPNFTDSILVSKFVVKGDQMVVIPSRMIHADVDMRVQDGELHCAGAVHIDLEPPKIRILLGYSRSLELFLPIERSQTYKETLREILGEHFEIE